MLSRELSTQGIEYGQRTGITELTERPDRHSINPPVLQTNVHAECGGGAGVLGFTKASCRAPLQGLVIKHIHKSRHRQSVISLA